MKKNEDIIISKSSFVSEDVKFVGKVIIGENSYIGPGTYLENCIIGNNTKITYSYIENSVIKDNCTIGPYAHIKQDSVIEDNCRIGNYVEIKNSIIHKGVKAAHLAYLGDCEVGEETNVGCGVITANYDGKDKHKTHIGKNCFIGCNSNLIAPITIGDNCYIAAGTTLSKSLEDNSFAITRSELIIKKNKRS